MPKSEIAKRLDEVQKPVQAFLRPLGFRKRGRAHNRPAEDGLVHVVKFWMGPYPVGDYVVPGLRENLYGRFTVSLGVFLPCIWEMDQQDPTRPGFIQEYHCSIRESLGGGQEWWEIGPDTDAIATRVVAALSSHGFPFLDRFLTYEDVLAERDRTGKLPFSNPGRAALEAAVVALTLGDRARATELFRAACDTDHAEFANHVADVADRYGCPLD